MKQLLTLAIAVSAASVLALVLIPFTTANAVTNVTFAVPQGSEAPFTAEDARIIVIGAPTSTSPGGNCNAETELPVQEVLVTARGPTQGLPEKENIVILSGTPLQRGSQIEITGSAGPTCTIDGINYDRFTGTVGE